MRDYNSEGIALPSIFAGKIGLNARALGGALLPMRENFAADNEIVNEIIGAVKPTRTSIGLLA